MKYLKRFQAKTADGPEISPNLSGGAYKTYKTPSDPGFVGFVGAPGEESQKVEPAPLAPPPPDSSRPLPTAPSIWALAWLRTLLARGPVSAEQFQEAYEAAGFRPRMACLAADALGCQVEDRDGVEWLSLPDAAADSYATAEREAIQQEHTP